MPKIFRVRVSGPEAGVRKFLATHPMEPQGVMVSENAIRMDLYVDEEERYDLERNGLTIERELDATEHIRVQRRQIEVGNPFKDGGVPRGLGVKIG